MILYLSGLHGMKRHFDYVLSFKDDRLGVLVSYAECPSSKKSSKRPKKNAVELMCEAGFTNIMLDSGAFSVETRGLVLDIDSYADFVKDVRSMVRVACSLDVRGDHESSVKNWNYLRDVRGVDVMPCYHLGEPLEVLDYYCKSTDYVALGGIAGKSFNWKTVVPTMEKVFSRQPGVRYHIFGVNSPATCMKFPFYSSDSTTWLIGARLGRVIDPNGAAWQISPNSASALDYSTLDASGMLAWLEKQGITFPLPEDFSFYRLNEINIRSLYELLVLKHGEKKFHTLITNQGLW